MDMLLLITLKWDISLLRVMCGVLAWCCTRFLTGRLSLERNRSGTEQKLLEWVKQFPPDSKKFGFIMDHRLENQYSLTAARRIAKLADSYLLKSAKERPRISQVVEMLKQIMQVSEDGNPSDRSLESSDNDQTDL